MRLLREMFYSAEQFREHQNILKFPNVRCHDIIERGHSMMVFYKQGIADNAFIVVYHAEGGTSLLFEFASLDNIKTLTELLPPPKPKAPTKKERLENGV